MAIIVVLDIMKYLLRRFGFSLIYNGVMGRAILLHFPNTAVLVDSPSSRRAVSYGVVIF